MNDAIENVQVEIGAGRFNGEQYQPAHTQAEAQAACNALGWTLVEAVDADCAVWLVTMPARDYDRLESDGWLMLHRNGHYGQAEMP